MQVVEDYIQYNRILCRNHEVMNRILLGVENCVGVADNGRRRLRLKAEAVLESKSTFESEAVVKDCTRTFGELKVEL